MKVYIAIDGWDEDYDHVLGVFDTREAAEACVEREAVHYGVLDIHKKKPVQSGRVEEHEVQG